MNIQKEAGLARKMDPVLLLAQTIGILAVINGHYQAAGATINSFFPYYSWHMPFFIAVSGVLFGRMAKKKSFLRYLWGKCNTLLFPALFVNFCYGLISVVMRHYKFISYGSSLSVDSLLLSPFMLNYQFRNDISLWFIFQLFIIEMIANAVYRIPLKKQKYTDLLILIIALSLSFFSLEYRRANPHLTREKVLLLRTGFLFAFFAFGICYERYIKMLFTNRNRYLLGMGLAVGAQTLLLLLTNWDPYFNTRDMNLTRQPNSFLPFFTFLTAFFFVFCLCGLLSPLLEKSVLLKFIGSNIRYVVYHHQFAGIMIGVIALLLCASGNHGLVPEFDVEPFRTKPWYSFRLSTNGFGKLPYLFIPFFGPILTSKLINRNPNKKIRFILWCSLLGLILGFFIITGRYFQDFLRNA